MLKSDYKYFELLIKVGQKVLASKTTVNDLGEFWALRAGLDTDST